MGLLRQGDDPYNKNLSSFYVAATPMPTLDRQYMAIGQVVFGLTQFERQFQQV